MKILVIEDEAPIRKFLKASFSEDEVEWFESETGQAGIRLCAQKSPEILLLDLGLPDMDGFAVITEVRSWSSVPIIVLSARGQERDKVRALDMGADDYLTKPFSTAELMARIRVCLRNRKQEADASQLAIGELLIDIPGHRAAFGGRELSLTQIEFKLLVALARHHGKVLTHNHLLTEVWGQAYEDSTHTLRVHMANLRQKLDQVTGDRLIRTETGVGYRLM